MCTDLCSLFISLPMWFVCHHSSELQKEKWSKEDVYCNNGAEAGWAWPGARCIFLSVARSLFSATRFQTDTLIYSKSASPHRWNCFHGNDTKGKFQTVHLTAKILKSGHGWCCVSITAAESGEQLSHHQTNKTCRKCNYVSVNCEPFSLCLSLSGRV